jgi:hypothetical protein
MQSTSYSYQILIKLEFLDSFLKKNTQISSFKQIRPAVGGEGRLVALRNFANSPNKVTEAA